MYIKMSIDPTTLGGGVNGISPKQTINCRKSSEEVISRRILRDVWNKPYATGTVNGYSRATSSFPAVYNITDFLSRTNYVCGGPTPVQPNSVKWRNRIGSIINNCDGTGIESSNTNTKYVSDSSLYTRYRREKVMNQNYNDNSTGGDANHATYVARMAVLHGIHGV